MNAVCAADVPAVWTMLFSQRLKLRKTDAEEQVAEEGGDDRDVRAEAELQHDVRIRRAHDRGDDNPGDHRAQRELAPDRIRRRLVGAAVGLGEAFLFGLLRLHVAGTIRIFVLKSLSMPNPPPPPAKEQRCHPRLELLASVEVMSGTEVLILPAINVSLGGALIGSDGQDLSAIPIGKEIEVSLFDVMDETQASLRMAAKVVRRNKDGIALQSIGADPNITARLASLLEQMRPRGRR